MIKLSTIEGTDPNHFVMQVDEPVTIEVIQLASGQLVMHVNRGIDAVDYEPIVVYDSDADPKVLDRQEAGE
jgi:hypothetical protein